MANSECGEHIRITAAFENVSERNKIVHVFNANDETRNDIPDKVNGLPVPGTHLDQQPHTLHNYAALKMHTFKAFFLLRSLKPSADSHQQNMVRLPTVAKNYGTVISDLRLAEHPCLTKNALFHTWVVNPGSY